MTTPGRRGVLTKGITHSLGRRSGYDLTIGIAKSDKMDELEKLAHSSEVIERVRADARGFKNDLVKVFSDDGAEDPIGQADAVIAAVQSGQSVRNFLAGSDNASPGQRPGIISTQGDRKTGWTDQNQFGSQAPGQKEVSGDEDEKTPDKGTYDNPKTLGQGYAYEAGHERYGSTGVGGTGEDTSPGRAPTARTRYGLGGQQPNNISAKPGRTGGYGAPASIVTSTSTPRVEVHKHTHESAKLFEKDVGDNPALSDYMKLAQARQGRAIDKTTHQALDEEGRERAAKFEEEREEGAFAKLDEEDLGRIKRLLEEEEAFRAAALKEEDEDLRVEYEAKAISRSLLRKQLETKLSIDTGLAVQSIEKQIRRGRIFSLEK